MGSAKTEICTDPYNGMAIFAKVFGHPARVSILQHCSIINACSCEDLINEIGSAQPSIPRHLKEPKHLGLIIGNAEDISVFYGINTKSLSRNANLKYHSELIRG